jgi:hypothetical protein
MGWDEVCDNQRWAIDKVLNGQTVFQPNAGALGTANTLAGRVANAIRRSGPWPRSGTPIGSTGAS